MKKAIIMPGKYIQGEGVLAELANYVKQFGLKPAINWDQTTKKITNGVVEASLHHSGLEYYENVFSGECTRDEAEAFLKQVKEAECDVIVGIGGGKSIDTAKAAAGIGNLPLIIVPTIASNDAPTSASTVWYNAEGECLGLESWNRNPDAVLVDTGIIAKAPVRFLVAGIGDALATWLEANAANKSRAVAYSGGVPTITGMSLAKLCFDILMEYGLEAKSAAENKVVTSALEKIIEANILLSGIGWESGGIAAAHGIANYLPEFPETHQYLHGEKVAFGIISQLCLEEELAIQEVYKIVDFMIEIGLPVTFEELNMKDVSMERIRAFGDVAAAPDSCIHNHNFKVTPESVTDAMIAADALGRRRKQHLKNKNY